MSKDFENLKNNRIANEKLMLFIRIGFNEKLFSFCSNKLKL